MNPDATMADSTPAAVERTRLDAAYRAALAEARRCSGLAETAHNNATLTDSPSERERLCRESNELSSRATRSLDEAIAYAERHAALDAHTDEGDRG